MTETASPTPAPRPQPKRRRKAVGFWLLIFALVTTSLVGFGILGLTGRPIKLPVWAVAEVESRLNTAMAGSNGGLSVSVGAIELMVDHDWVPRLALDDLRILQADGAAVMTLPEVRASFDPKMLLKGSLRAQTLNIVGGRFAIKRNADGKLDLNFGNTSGTTNFRSLADVLDAADTTFSSPALAQLSEIQAEALTLTLTDERSGQQWQAGDGRIVLENRPNELAAELSMSLAIDQTRPAIISITSISDKQSAKARLVATVDGIAARDLAAQSAPLAWLAALDAPIAGRLSATIEADGTFGPLESTLEISKGVLKPTSQTAPIAFDRAGLTLAYDPKLGRIDISKLTVEGPSLRLSASGQSYISDLGGKPLSGDLVGATPAVFLSQMAFSEVIIDPAGLFQSPVQFSAGSLDLRLTLAPFAIEIGQMTLTEQDTHISLRGQIAADPKGWRVGLDVGLDQIPSGKLIALWPVRLVPKTRDWLALNLLEGTLFDVKGAVRLAPETEPKLSLGYEFQGTDVRFLKALPPVRAASGYSTIEGKAYSLVVEKGHVTPPKGGDIDVAGTVFQILDITQKPTVAQITLKTDSNLTATLSLLDQPPFQFLTKANRPVDLGEGRAKLQTKLRFPLKPKVLLEDVTYDVTGQITDFTSSVLVPGRSVSAQTLHVAAGRDGLEINGKGQLDTLPFDVTFAQAFGPAAKGHSTVAGNVELTDSVLRDFGVALPKGMIKGTGSAQVKIDLNAAQPPKLQLSSDLQGLELALPALGWSKSEKKIATLTLDAVLGKIPSVQSFVLEGAGLRANGTILLQDGGGLNEARFDRVQLDDWLDAGITLRGRGQGRPVGISVTSGKVDLRQLAVRTGENDAQDGPMDVQLNQLVVTDGITLTGFAGAFTSKNGFQGDFSASVNNEAPIRGTVSPSPAGSAVQISSDDAGRVMAAAHIFKDARGGSLDLQLVPTGAKGEYNGRAKIGTIRVKNASVLAELLSAISVIGVLEQLNGSGLVFSQADVDFRLTPDAVEVSKGSAIGASLGVSLAGIYETESKRLNMQGVVSPIYLLNGVGAFLTRKGEGLFGFNYKLRGTADDPKVSVNPLSILTPGMFRDIFRKSAPVLSKGTE